jgi:hypothetical protein
MIFGAWIHTGDNLSLGDQLAAAAASGITSIRSYSLGYATQAAAALQHHDVGLLAGMHIDAEALVADWRSQVRLDDLARVHEMGVRLDAICVGNELREGGDEPDKKRFTARLSFGLARVLETYRGWMESHGLSTPLTYAMEGIVCDAEGRFHEWLWPLVDACDWVGLNLYPMGNAAWFTFDAFEESRRFLLEPRVRHDRLALFELHLRRALAQAASVGKPLILTETGFPSAVGYRLEDEQTAGRRRVVPIHDTDAYADAMSEFVGRIRTINAEYNGQIRALYFYEWRDNLHHAKIWNVEQSPIHVAFGLCDRLGAPKFDISALLH